MRVSDSLLLLFLLAGAAAGCGSGAAAGGERPYRVAAVDAGEVQVFVEETGLVEPERQIVVKSPISGIVSRLLVREGARVRAGQVLARIVPDIAQANAFARLRSDIAGARIARDRARSESERAALLVPNGGITREEAELKEAAWRQADNALQVAEEQLRLVQLSGVTAGDSAQFALITAPTSGVVILRGVEEGETVVGGTSTFGGGTELFTIADLSALRIKAAVNEVDIGKVAEGDSVSLTLDAFPGDTVRGVVRLVPPAARQQDRVRVFDVEVAVRGDFGVLRPGMTANVRIAGPARRDVIRVPVEAVFLSEGQPIVYRLRNGEPERTPVELGLGDLSWVEVLGGVAVGDTVALEDPVAAAERAARVSQ
jgi:RND family efflux transporter MFP subunit